MKNKRKNILKHRILVRSLCLPPARVPAGTTMLRSVVLSVCAALIPLCAGCSVQGVSEDDSKQRPPAQVFVTYTGTATCTVSNKEITGVTAKNAAGKIETVTLGNDISNGKEWSLRVPSYFVPAKFTVALKGTGADNASNYESGVIAVEDAKPAVPIPLEITNANQLGSRISTPEELLAALGSSSSKNWALANDIDLDQYNGNWIGPSGYNKIFYGNGYTIKNLRLTSLTGDTGLFTTLGNGAVIQDLVIEVSTKAGVGDRPRTGSSHFGAIVGFIGNATVSLKNIKVKGSLNFGAVNGSTTYYLLAGGFVGEIGNGAVLNIENCVSELNIALQAGSQNTENTLGFGGLVGKAYENTKLTINKSYVSGDINVVHAGNKQLIAGGLVGDVADATKLTVTGCYVSGTVIAKNMNAGNNGNVHAGGLVGRVNSPMEIKNSAVVSPKVVAVAPSGKYNNGRFFGAVSGGSKTYSANIARKGMRTGNTEDGIENNDDGGLTTSAGLGVLLAQLKTPAPWKETLGWTETVWNFSGLAQEKWPVLVNTTVQY
ncbi:MAG: hypothetical protein LBD07_02370 [Spirochaetaceae bacterium]|nr:hypothetical protein [Spirochaetaceae bacterium]